MDETKGFVIGFCAAMLAIVSIAACMAAYSIHDLDTAQKKMTACVQAGNIWVQNSNREMECRKG